MVDSYIDYVENSIIVRGFSLSSLKNQNDVQSIKQTLKKLISEQNKNLNQIKKSIKNKPILVVMHFFRNYKQTNLGDDINYDNFIKLLVDILSDNKDERTSQIGLGLITTGNQVSFYPYIYEEFSNNENEGFKITISETNIEYMEKGICEDCEKPLNDCTCGYNRILDIPGFIQQRSQHIFNKKRCKITEFRELSFFITEILDHMPNLYSTRSGHEIENVEDTNYSNHDAARFIGTSITHEMNELLVNLTVGSYNSSIRGIRNLFEWVIRTTVGMSDPSSITDSDKDKNVVTCFHTIKETYRSAMEKQTMDSQTKKSFKKDIENDPQLSERDKRVLLAHISSGVGKFIDRCDSEFLKYIRPKNQDNTPKKELYNTYDQLSQYTHKSSELLESMEQNHGEIFFEQDEFDSAFRLCYIALDYIFYFYLILLDFDVFHGDLELKSRWRKNIRGRLHNMILSEESMISTRLLVNSKEWNSKPPKEFVNFRSNSKTN